MNEYKEGDQVVTLFAFENKHKGRIEAGTVGTVVDQQGDIVKVLIRSDYWLFFTREIRSK